MKKLSSSVLVAFTSVFAGLIVYLLLSGVFIQGFHPLKDVVETTTYGSFTYLVNELYYVSSAISYNMEDIYNFTHLYDFSLNERFGNKTGSLEFESGVYGRSLRWMSGQIVAPDLDIVDISFTVEAWIYPTSEETLALAGCQFYPYILKHQNGSMQYQWSGGEAVVYSSQPVKLNAWTHVALVYDAPSGVAKWYLNATEQGSKTIDTARDWDGKWSIGHIRPDYVPFEWKGKIDEFRIYKGGALSQTKILQDMNTPIMHKLTLTGLTPNSDVAQLWYTSANPYGMLQQTADADGKVEFNVYSFSDGEPFYNGVLKVIHGTKTYTSPNLELEWEDVYSLDVHSNYTEAQFALLIAALTIIVPPALLVIYRYIRKHRKLA